MVGMARPVLVIITKRDTPNSSFDAATGLCDFDLSSSAPTSEAIANAINRVRAAVMLEAILGGKSLIMAPIRGSACTVKPRFNVILVHRSSTVYRSIARNSRFYYEACKALRSNLIRRYVQSSLIQERYSASYYGVGNPIFGADLGA
jgi:hypothetical protein